MDIKKIGKLLTKEPSLQQLKNAVFILNPKNPLLKKFVQGGVAPLYPPPQPLKIKFPPPKKSTSCATDLKPDLFKLVISLKFISLLKVFTDCWKLYIVATNLMRFFSDSLKRNF